MCGTPESIAFPRLFLGFLVLVLSVPTPGADPPDPIETGLKEEVQVDLAQIEVTVWPKAGRSEGACADLTTEDFELVVNGRGRPIHALDWLGSKDVMEAIEGTAINDPAEPPLTIVLFFDLWHLDLFYKDFDCPITKPLAFEQARELVRKQFRPGDRLLLVTFAGWPRIHGGWIRQPEQALRALERLEVDPFVLNARKTHLHHRAWIEGIKSLLLALGNYPGRKEVFYFADDFRFDDVALSLFDIAARAQANQVSIHAVDLLASCRSMPGRGCSGIIRGGLACTDFVLPIALGYISANTGGVLFNHNETLADAVETVRRMRGCRYLLSFPVIKQDGKRSPKVTVRLNRKGLRLYFPASYENPRRESTEREKQDALFLLPRFGRGIEAEIGLWPLKPSGKKKKWNGVILARLKRTPHSTWPETVHRIEIESVAHTGSKIYGNFRKVISGEELDRFRNGDPKLLVFPVNGIRPGYNTVSIRALGVGGEISANVRAWSEVPEPPEPGKAGPWMLVDGLARLGDRITVMPALEGILPAKGAGLILGYSCPGEEAPDSALIHAMEDDREIDVPLEWMDPRLNNGECGWLAGKIDTAELGPGLYRFEPPPSLMPETKEKNPLSVVEFRIDEP